MFALDLLKDINHVSQWAKCFLVWIQKPWGLEPLFFSQVAINGGKHSFVCIPAFTFPAPQWGMPYDLLIFVFFSNCFFLPMGRREPQSINNTTSLPLKTVWEKRSSVKTNVGETKRYRGQQFKKKKIQLKSNFDLARMSSCPMEGTNPFPTTKSLTS